MRISKYVFVIVGFGLMSTGLLSSDLLYPSVSTVYATELRLQNVVDEVLMYAEHERADDPLVEIEPAVWVKSSNFSGVDVMGETYYYTLLPHMSFDPIARGEVGLDDVTIVYEDDNATHPIVIYQLKNE